MLESGALVIFGLAMISTVFLLGIGCAVGNYFGRQCAQRVVASVQQVAPIKGSTVADSGELVDLSRKLKDESAAVSQILADHRLAVPRELACATERLVVTSSRMAKQVEGIRDITNSIPIHPRHLPTQSPDTPIAVTTPRAVHLPPADSAFSITGTGTLTPEEMHSFRTAAGATPIADDNSNKRRYPYDCFQTVIPKVDGKVIDARATRVRCHEISAHSLSFFWPDVPDFHKAVISLGAEPAQIFVRADVVQSKAVFMHNEVQVLVECQFTGRYESPSEEAAVAIKSDGCNSATAPVLLSA